MRASDRPTATIEAVSANQDGRGRFIVSGALSFDTVPDLLKQAKRLFASVDTAIVDFSGVGSCNSAGLAVVLEMASMMREQKKTICFRAVPEQLHTFARAYSVDNELTKAGLLC